jgi:hypothetical protein
VEAAELNENVAPSYSVGDEWRREGINCKQTNSVSFSLRANYTDRVTAICRQSLLPTFADRGVSRGQRGGTHTAVNLRFLDQSRCFFFQVTPQLSSRG